MNDSEPRHKAKSVTGLARKRCIANNNTNNKTIEKIISVLHHDQEIQENCRENIESQLQYTSYIVIYIFLQIVEF